MDEVINRGFEGGDGDFLKEGGVAIVWFFFFAKVMYGRVLGIWVGWDGMGGFYG